jgi:hypothetical protein
MEPYLQTGNSNVHITSEIVHSALNAARIRSTKKYPRYFGLSTDEKWQMRNIKF